MMSKRREDYESKRSREEADTRLVSSQTVVHVYWPNHHQTHLDIILITEHWHSVLVDDQRLLLHLQIACYTTFSS